MTDKDTDAKTLHGSDSSPPNFIREIIRSDIKENRYGGDVITRFPPEPNGYLHIGHAKSICLNFGLARDFHGRCHLRFDDTNPTKEETEYVEAIKEDVRWLGFDWGTHEYYASNYFEQLYEFAATLIRTGKAYVDSLTADEIREYRGTLTEPGRESPYRNRPVEESLDLFVRMRAGEFPDGTHVVRAKIDMAAPNIIMRDPTIFRIRHATHHRTGDRWCIYPMYDFAHCLSDAIEGITHSICTLEFENNREIYDWVLDQLVPEPRPHQYEFARLNLSYTVLSKRKLIRLVDQHHVTGWDDPRMPTISGLRRRGYTPRSLRRFCERIGVAKRDSMVDVALLEHCVREDLNDRAPRMMGVLKPLRVVIDNYPEDHTETFSFQNHPEKTEMGTRDVPFSRVIYVERDDFREEAPRKWFRLAPGREVRLRYAYYITCNEVIKDEETGQVVELRCSYDPESRGGSSPDGRKVRGTLHWVSAAHAVPAEVRLYDHLFTRENPNEVAPGETFIDHINPASLEVLEGCLVEPGLAEADPAVPVQFERIGYFVADARDSRPDHLVFNRTATLRDTWAKIEKAAQKPAAG